MTGEENVPSAQSGYYDISKPSKGFCQISLCAGKLVILDHLIAYQNLDDLTFNSATLTKLTLTKAQAQHLHLHPQQELQGDWWTRSGSSGSGNVSSNCIWKHSYIVCL